MAEKQFKTKDMIIAVICTLLAILCIVFYFLPAFSVQHSPNLTFDEVANEFQNGYIFEQDYGPYEVQCSDKILVAIFDEDKWEWTITEK